MIINQTTEPLRKMHSILWTSCLVRFKTLLPVITIHLKGRHV